MKQLDRHKARERFFAEHYLKLTGTDAELTPSEQPDFLLMHDAGIAGLEVVECYPDAGPHGSMAKRGEVARLDFLGAVLTTYYDDGGLPINVSAFLRYTPPEHMIAPAVRRLRAARSSTTWKQRRTYLLDDHALLGTLYVTALPPECGRYSRWACASDGSGLVGRLGFQPLHAAVHDKATKLATYRARAGTDDIRLLIVVDRTANSGRFEIDPAALKQDTGGFSRVHVLVYPEGCYELR